MRAEEIRDIYDNRISRNPLWKILDFDKWTYYEDFSDNDLDDIIEYIEDKIIELNKEVISNKKLQESIDNFDKYVEENIEQRFYKTIGRIDNPDKYIFDLKIMRNNAHTARIRSIKNRIEQKLKIKVRVSDDMENRTYHLHFKEGPLTKEQEEFVEQVRKDWDTERYGEAINKAEEIKARSYQIEEDLAKLYETYYAEKLDYRRRAIKKQERIERWARIIWSINTEKRIREHERTEGLKIIRKPISNESKEWKEYKINENESGLINNVFVMVGEIPYRLLLMDEQQRPRNKLKYSVAYLEVPYDLEYEPLFTGLYPDFFYYTTHEKFPDRPTRFDVMLAEGSDYYNKIIDINLDVRGVEYYSPERKDEDVEDYDEEDEDIEESDEITIEEIDDEEEDDFEDDDSSLPDILEMEDEDIDIFSNLLSTGSDKSEDEVYKDILDTKEKINKPDFDDLFSRFTEEEE